MASFLDKKSQVIDMVLTNYGKEQLAKGQLEFVYYAFSDDAADYNVWLSNSGSLSDVEVTASKEFQLEHTLTTEALYGMRPDVKSNNLDNTNITNLLFTIPQGQTTLPRVTITPPNLTGSLEATQIKLQSVTKNDVLSEEIGEVGYKTDNSSQYLIDLDLPKSFLDKSNSEFLIRIFESGSFGLKESNVKFDKDLIMSINDDLKIFIDTDVDQMISTEKEELIGEDDVEKV